MASQNIDAARPDPEALLELAGRERRGKLTVFLGAAPGVGKTYAMLARARALHASGTDVVVGLVETHGRSETAVLLDGLEVLPRRPSTTGGGAAYDEFDLDAALQRHPALILVDELAHSNAAGSRHPKRYQDVAELIAAGIDVWTALNVQHLESLSDLVANIAGVPVRETVPDTVLKAADEVVLIDLPPAELIARLEEGKVYLPDTARRAADNFFRPATLTALRELALRRAADRVDDQMVDFLKQSAVEGPWATGERLLVCVGPDPLAEKLVRTASRLASGLNARWTVLSLARPGVMAGDAAEAARLDAVLQLAERLGAEVQRVTADDFVAEIVRIAQRENVTQIVVGRPLRPWWARLGRRQLPDEIVRHAGEIGVFVVQGDGAPGRRRRARPERSAAEWLVTLALPIGSVGVTTLVGLGLSALVALQNLSMLYLAAVVLSAILSGRISALLAAGLSFLAYNFFFIDPVGTFTVARPQEVLALLIFVGVALSVGTLAAQLRDVLARTRRQAQATQALFDFSRKLAASFGSENVATAIASHLHGVFGRPTVVLLPGDTGQLGLAAAWPPDQELDDAAMAAARWALSKREPAGFMTGTLPHAPYLFRPVLSAQRSVGVVGLLLDRTAGPLPAEQDRTLSALLEQAAVALDRARLAQENAAAALAREGERLQTALLSSLSHDLKTPLASITGAVTTLRQLGERMDAPTREDLLESIEEESGRLSRFVGNLFDMTRIESGSLRPRREPVAVAEAVEHALARARALHPDLAVETSFASDLRPALADPALLDAVLFNLIDNAHKYGGEQPISVFARKEGRQVVVTVTDLGKGIPPAELERVFEKFYRRAKGDGRPAGTGLGLSIARGFIQAMGGTLRAESPAVRKRGTRFVIRLPLAGEGDR